MSLLRSHQKSFIFRTATDTNEHMTLVPVDAVLQNVKTNAAYKSQNIQRFSLKFVFTDCARWLGYRVLKSNPIKQVEWMQKLVAMRIQEMKNGWAMYPRLVPKPFGAYHLANQVRFSLPRT